MSRGSSPAWLCWSKAHLVQCEPDEPSWIWTQIWVQARMPGYSLNWKVRSSDIQRWQRCRWCSSPTRRWPSRNPGPFGLKSAMEHWPSGTDARQSAEKSLHEAQRLVELLNVSWNQKKSEGTEKQEESTVNRGDIFIDWFYRYVNLYGVILCPEVKELCILYVYIYIFCVVFFASGYILYELFPYNTNNLQTYLIGLKIKP